MDGVVSIERYGKLKRQYDELRLSYNELLAKHAKCTARVQRAEEKYAAAKESARAWTEYLERKGLIPKNPTPGPTSSNARSFDDADPKRITSSQTTEGDLADAAPEQAEVTSDEAPQVVCARSVKRKWRGSTAQMPPPTKIKTEPSTLDMTAIPAGSNYSPARQRTGGVGKETSDLDAPVEPFKTPRKRKDVRARSEETVRPAAALLGRTSSLSEGDLPAVYEDDATVKGERDGAGGSPNDDQRTHRGLQPDSMNQALRQRSVNVPTPKKKIPQSATYGKSKRPTLAEPARLLSEDGDYESLRTTTPAPDANGPSHTDQRLNTLLASNTTERTRLQNPQPRKLKDLQRRSTGSPASRESITPRSTVPTPTTSCKRPRGLEPCPPPPLPEDEPLRSRPLATLHPEDFRINPKYLGSDFAFADTLRGRDQRRCLPGCTRPECCGNAFKGAVQFAFNSTADASSISPSSTDAKALEAYLGPSYRDILDTYTPAKRQELLLDARAFALANAHGKHRSAFERRSTPPGFWRTDMPSTQEEAEDRESARLLEREKVERRWREAMRGGRWLFRDEVE